MPVILTYLFKLSISLGIVWLFYQLLLRRLTFYTSNRWYLLGYSLLSFFIPLIHIGVIFSKGPSQEPVLLQLIPVFGGNLSLPAAARPGWNSWDSLLLFVVVGVVVLLVRSLIRWSSLRRIRRQSRLMVNDGALRIYQVDQPIRPFSFGNAIYINQQLHSGREWEEILLHEYVHIRERHTVDLIWMELLCVLNWYNPFSWLIRHSVRQNLEFIADRQVLANGFDKKSYQYHLLKVVGEPRFQLANNFNFSSLKKRIIMMNKIRSSRLHLVKFLFILPLIGVLLLAFRDRQLQAEGIMFHETRYKPVVAAGDTAVPMRKPVTDTLPVKARAGARVAAPASPAPAVSAPGAPVSAVSVSTPAVAPVPVASVGTPAVAPVPAPPVPASPVPGATVSATTDARPYRVVVDSLQKNQPLFLVDGVELSWADNGLSKLNPNDIAYINVVKGAAAIAAYGEKGRNGVILITTKKYKAAHPEAKTVRTGTALTDSARVSPVPVRDTLGRSGGKDGVTVILR